MQMRLIVKRFVQYVAVVMVFPSAAACGFGRFKPLFSLFAHSYSLAPGFVGDLWRTAFYHLTLEACSLDTVICFGSFFSRSDARVEPFVSIGAYCIIGSAHIGTRTQVASHVEIPSGRHQHSRQEAGGFDDEVKNDVVSIGRNCWIGTAAIIMANVGESSTIGAGSIVVKEIPAQSVAVGNPAKVIRSGASPA